MDPLSRAAAALRLDLMDAVRSAYVALLKHVMNRSLA